MKLIDRYDGSNDPFEGDRTLLLKTIPVGARINRASAVITPVDATGGVNPFTETITFTRTSGTWGATKTSVLTAQARWVEVDFHARRTLAGVNGSGLTNSTLQVDLGGAFVEINANGGIKTPSDSGILTLQADSQALPSLTVTKLKLTNLSTSPTPNNTPDLAQVTIRSTPSNVSLRLGDLPALLTRPGELVSPEATNDFTTALQASLSSARTENNFYLLPLVLHSDSIARLAVVFDIEYVIEQSVLPDNLEEVTLPFDFSGRAQSRGDLLRLIVPPDSRLSASGTAARVKGTFEDTRLVAETKIDDVPSDAMTVEVSATQSQAQPITLSAETLVTDVDLLVRVARTVRLQLDLRDDADGKPASSSLLPAPVEFELSGHTGEVEKDKTQGTPKWVSVHLPAEFKFKALNTYWLILQSVEEDVSWFVTPAPDATLGLQSTIDGGLSWRAAAVSQETGDLKTFFRLRRRPAGFEMPIELQVGEGSDAVRVGLERFQALGRVDFTLDANDLAGAVNQYLKKAARAACPEVEHLSNGDFEQWLRVGDTLSEPVKIPLAAAPLSIAAAPDGAWTYIGLRRGESNGVLQIIDTACQVLRGDEIPLPIIPSILLISSDGLHAFVCDTGRIQVIDTSTHQTLGLPFSPGTPPANMRLREIEVISLSADGARLYVIQDFISSTGSTESPLMHRIDVFDTGKLLQVITGSNPNPDEARIASENINLPATATALAISPDDSRLYVTVAKSDLSGELHILDTSNLSLRGEVVPVGRSPVALALTPDGKQALVSNFSDNTISVITISSGSRPVPASVQHVINVGTGPGPIAIAQDSVRAYIINATSGTLTHVDLTRHSVVKDISIGPVPYGLALTPQGDTAYTIHLDNAPTEPEKYSLSVIQIGLRQPVEWNLTSGWVKPLCLPEPFRQVAILGLPQQQSGDDVEQSKMLATGLSQVVPVAENCTYDFSFWALASDPDALAEVFWLNSDCKLLQPDEPNKVFIEALPQTPGRTSSDLALFRATRTIMERAPLLLHRKRLTTPAGAVQAEIRFNVPSGAMAAIEGASLVGANEALENSDLLLQREGRLVSWQLSPGVAAGVSLLAAEDGVQFRNAGANQAELVQTIPAEAEKDFTLEWQGQAEARPSVQANPRLELYWLDAENKRVGVPTILELSPKGFGTASATGATPPRATKAEMHLVVPAGTTQKVKRVSLRFLPATVVPISFIAQAPGELTVLDWRVAFEKAESAPPPIPEDGLCQSTPPGQTPGAQTTTTANGSQFCPHCQDEQTISDNSRMQTRSQRTAMIGLCTNCGNEVVRFSGQSAETLPQLSLARSLVARPILHLSGARNNIAFTSSPNTRAVAPSQPFEAIIGIAEVRTKQLVALGINSIEALAHATPEDVAQAKSIPLPLAANFIAQAKELLSSR
jgi:DNA-binding beta-propeller fold protein YncE